jgi:hypothetical protein
MLVLDAYGTQVPLVDSQGKFTSHIGEYAGKYVKRYYEDGEAPDRPLMLRLQFCLKKTKHLKWRNMSIVIHIVGEQTNQFYTIL